MCKILSLKAYKALKNAIEEKGVELKQLKEAYNRLLDKHEEALNDLSDKEKHIVSLNDKIEQLTPYRDSKGRFAKRPN